MAPLKSYFQNALFSEATHKTQFLEHNELATAVGNEGPASTIFLRREDEIYSMTSNK